MALSAYLHVYAIISHQPALYLAISWPVAASAHQNGFFRVRRGVGDGLWLHMPNHKCLMGKSIWKRLVTEYI